MYLFDELFNIESINMHVNFNIHNKEPIMTMRDKVTFYFTKLNDDIMFYNTAGTYEGFQMYWNSSTILYNLKNKKRKLVIKNKDTISHNFTLILNDPNRKSKYYAVGGCGKDGKWAMQKHRHYKKGIYLLESNDLENWNIVQLIIDGKKYNGWNPVHRESIFDSNIDCFYSNILKKYLLFTRFNKGVGSRTIQVITSDNYLDWDMGQMCEIDTYKSYDNYYMCKILEIPELKIFLMISPFSVLRPPLELIRKGKVLLEDMNFMYGFKLLLSYDAVNWKDCGMIAHLPPAQKHDATPVMQPTSFKMIGKYEIELEFHDLYFTKEESTLYRTIIDLRKFLGVKITDTIIFNKNIKFSSHKFKIRYSNLPSNEICKQSDIPYTLEEKVKTQEEIEKEKLEKEEIEKEEIEKQEKIEKEEIEKEEFKNHCLEKIKELEIQRDTEDLKDKGNLYKKCFRRNIANQISRIREDIRINNNKYKKNTKNTEPPNNKLIKPKLGNSYLLIYINGISYNIDNNGIVEIPKEIILNKNYEVTFKARNIILYSIE